MDTEWIKQLQALQNPYTDRESFFFADKYLQEWQRTPQAWEISIAITTDVNNTNIELLNQLNSSGISREIINLYCSQTLKSMSRRSLKMLSNEMKLQSCEAIKNALEQYSTFGYTAQQRPFIKQLCIVLADLCLWEVRDEKPILELLSSWSDQPHMAETLLYLLTFFPEQLEGPKYMFDRDTYGICKGLLYKVYSNLDVLVLDRVVPNIKTLNNMETRIFELYTTWIHIYDFYQSVDPERRILDLARQCLFIDEHAEKASEFLLKLVYFQEDYVRFRIHFHYIYPFFTKLREQVDLAQLAKSIVINFYDRHMAEAINRLFPRYLQIFDFVPIPGIETKENSMNEPTVPVIYLENEKLSFFNQNGDLDVPFYSANVCLALGKVLITYADAITQEIYEYFYGNLNISKSIMNIVPVAIFLPDENTKRTLFLNILPEFIRTSLDLRESDKYTLHTPDEKVFLTVDSKADKFSLNQTMACISLIPLILVLQTPVIPFGYDIGIEQDIKRTMETVDLFINKIPNAEIIHRLKLEELIIFAKQIIQSGLNNNSYVNILSNICFILGCYWTELFHYIKDIELSPVLQVIKQELKQIAIFGTSLGADVITSSTYIAQLVIESTNLLIIVDCIDGESVSIICQSIVQLTLNANMINGVNPDEGVSEILSLSVANFDTCINRCLEYRIIVDISVINYVISNYQIFFKRFRIADLKAMTCNLIQMILVCNSEEEEIIKLLNSLLVPQICILKTYNEEYITHDHPVSFATAILQSSCRSLREIVSNPGAKMIMESYIITTLFPEILNILSHNKLSQVAVDDLVDIIHSICRINCDSLIDHLPLYFEVLIERIKRGWIFSALFSIGEVFRSLTLEQANKLIPVTSQKLLIVLFEVMPSQRPDALASYVFQDTVYLLSWLIRSTHIDTIEQSPEALLGLLIKDPKIIPSNSFHTVLDCLSILFRKEENKQKRIAIYSIYLKIFFQSMMSVQSEKKLFSCIRLTEELMEQNSAKSLNQIEIWAEVLNTIRPEFISEEEKKYIYTNFGTVQIFEDLFELSKKISIVQSDQVTITIQKKKYIILNFIKTYLATIIISFMES